MISLPDNEILSTSDEEDQEAQSSVKKRDACHKFTQGGYFYHYKTSVSSNKR